ncbi:SDR family NAD(P)-dependent oxidoreductase [Streptomyces sp. NPDC001982]|uniref:SDR family NAD(P)-dependent oxidoreductase n=1 Tax=Streptomyces sp. NPDC001982 TaxID=3154405 RepID=UPI0033277EA7
MNSTPAATSGSLAGKVALVTGASRGIGRGIALAFGREGAHVVVVSRSLDRLEEVVAEIEDKGGAATAVRCDIADRDQVVAAVEATVQAGGGLDVLVNNAQGFGTLEKPSGSPTPRPLAELVDAEWEYTIRTGPTATMWAMRAAFPYLKRNGGRVINFASGQGLRGGAGNAPYNCAKEATRALSRTAAREWGQYGITVNVICPLIRTELSDKFLADHPGEEEALLAELPLRKIGGPADAGELAVFLAGPGADYITGETILLDSGKNMGP